MQVVATSPTLTTLNATSYSITNGANDNFIIDGTSGIISVAPNTSLDLELEPNSYTITVSLNFGLQINSVLKIIKTLSL